MTAEGVHVFDETVQLGNIWLKSVMREMDTTDAHQGEAALRAALHALRDRIGPENAVHLGAQFPTLIRGLYYEGWRLSETPTKDRHVQEFLDRVAAELPRGVDVDPQRAARAVLRVLRQRLDPGEVAKIVRMLPPELRTLWPEDAQLV